MWWVGHVACMRRVGNVYTAREWHPGRPRCRWKDNSIDNSASKSFIWLGIGTSVGLLWAWLWTFGRVWTGFIWLRIRTRFVLLFIWQWMFGVNVEDEVFLHKLDHYQLIQVLCSVQLCLLFISQVSFPSCWMWLSKSSPKITGGICALYFVWFDIKSISSGSVSAVAQFYV
jgi:hypothetical protein